MNRDTLRITRMFGILVLSLLASAAAPPESAVADAAERRDAATVRALVAQGADVNAAQGDGTTALHWAAENGDLEIVRILVTAGAYLEAATRNGGYTPLHLASQVGNGEVVKALLDAGAAAGARSASGVTALHFAAASGSVEAVNALVARGADPNARESVADQTPLIFAAAADRPATVRALLAAGADPALATKVVDVVQMAKEDDAAREIRNAYKVIEWGRVLADSGYADTRTDEQKKLDEQKSAEETPPAEQKAPSDADRQQLSFPQLMSKRGGMTPLHHAAREGHTEAALALLEAGADVNQLAGDGSTPLLTATINGRFDLAMELLGRGADPTIVSVAGSTPLYGAINLQWAATSWYPQPTAQRQQETSYLELMRALLDAGADPNARLETELWYTEFSGGNLSISQWGATPFWRAAYGTDVAAMKLLIEFGADPTIATKKAPSRRRPGATDEADAVPPVPTGGPNLYPIHAATGAGYGLGFAGNAHQHAPDGWLPSVKYLVDEIGVDVNQLDASGYTALHNAASRGDNEVILLLVERGADVTIVARSGQTTVDMANGPSQRLTPFPETIALLESLGAVNNHNCVGC